MENTFIGLTVATIIVPISDYHTEIAHRAIASAHAQTVPVEVIPVYDHDKRGAAWTRNQGIAQVKTPFVIFLDADDVMNPAFVEKTFKRWLEAGAGANYVFTDWRLPDGRVRYAEECFDFFSTGMAHIITTLMPIATVYAVGGFDETIGGAGEEDEDFYARVHVAGCCHLRVSEPLVDYHIDQGRSVTNSLSNPDYAATTAAIEQRFVKKFSQYRGVIMGCCGDTTTPQGSVPLNEPFEGSVLAIALYTPTKQVGPVSGIGYKRAGLGQKMHVDQRDVAARPDLWQIVPKVENLVPPKEDVLKLAGLV